MRFTTRIKTLSASLFMGGCITLSASVYAVPPATESPKAAAAGAGNTITLNFTEADIRTIIEAVSKHTGMNFIIDPRVKGKVTIISQRPMNADQVYQVFQSVLKVHGFAAIPGKDAVKIVPDVNAKQDAIDTVSGLQGVDSDELVTQVIEVKHVNASQLVPILRPLVPQRGHLAAVPLSNVMIISDSANNIARLAQIIRRIDTATGDEIEIIPLQHASATELVRILNQLGSADPKAATGPKVVADDRTNSLLVSGEKSARLNIKALIMHLDTPLEIGGNTHVIYLRNAVAKDLVPVLTGVSQSVAKGAKGGAAPASSGGAVGDIVIQADENTNALVITAPPDVFRSLKTVISQLDVRRAQVLVEAVIAEVSEEASREIGVQWAVDGRDGGNAVGLVNFTLGTPLTAFANLENPPVAAGLNIGFGDFTGTTKLAALITALAGDSHSNVLATPSLMTLDNEEAEIVVGQNVPFVTGSFTNTGSSTPSNPFQTIQREDVGLTLKIKPQINEGDAIKIEVTQEVSSIAPSSAASDIITNKRSIKTNLLVDDGQIVVLGGLLQDDLVEAEQKVPGLGDIPLLGWLFRYQRTTKVKTNFMVFLHPAIVKDNGTMLSLTGEKYNYLRTKQLKMRENGLRLMADENIPVMQEMQDYIKLPPPYEQSMQRMELSAPDAMAPPAEDMKPTSDTKQPSGSKPAQEVPPDLPPFIMEDNAGKTPQ